MPHIKMYEANKFLCRNFVLKKEKKRSVWRMQENDDAYFIWYEAYRCCQRPKKPKIRKKEPLYFIVDEFNVYHKMLNEFAVVVCSHFGWVCCCCLQAESAHINCNKKILHFVLFITNLDKDVWKSKTKITTETIAMNFVAFHFSSI